MGSFIIFTAHESRTIYQARGSKFCIKLHSLGMIHEFCVEENRIHLNNGGFFRNFFFCKHALQCKL